MLTESLRVRKDGLLGPNAPAETELRGAADSLYDAAVQHLNEGKTIPAEDHAFSLLRLFTSQYPCLTNGALGVVAEDLAGARGAATAADFPDQVCAAFYVLGMTSMIDGHAQKSLLYFTVSERLMRRRIINNAANSVLCVGNYWNCLLHKGLAAKVLDRIDLLARVRAAFSRHSGSASSPIDLLRTTEEYRRVLARARVEL